MRDVNGHHIHHHPTAAPLRAKHAKRLLASELPSPRPGTAPTSPALSATNSRGYSSRHSAPPSPVLSSVKHQNGNSRPHPPVITSLQVPDIVAISPGLIREHNKPSSRTNVANKRLRKDNVVDSVETIEEDEPPSKKLKVARAAPSALTPQRRVIPPVKPTTNGVIQVDDDDVISVGSSSDGSCEVIDIPKTSNYKSSSSNNNQIYPPNNIPHPNASDGASLPGASVRRVVDHETNSQNSVRTNSPDIIIQSSLTPQNNSMHPNSSSVPSSTRSGRGRGRRRANATPAPLPVPEITKPSSSKSSKVKTTSQLVAELAQKKGDSLLAPPLHKIDSDQSKTSMIILDDEEVSNVDKMDHVRRYVHSLPSPRRTDSGSPLPSTLSPVPQLSTTSSPPEIIIPSPSPEIIETPVPPRIPEEDGEVNFFSGVLDRLGVKDDETAEQILSRLPPIDYEAARRADLEDEDYLAQHHGHTGG